MDIKLVYKVWKHTCNNYKEVTKLKNFDEAPVNKIIRETNYAVNQLNDDWDVKDPASYQDWTDNVLGILDDADSLDDLKTVLSETLFNCEDILKDLDSSKEKEIKQTNKEIFGK